MMVALFDDTSSSDNTMDAITDIREAVGKKAFIGGMSAVVTDIKAIVESEMIIYIGIAVLLTLIILIIVMDSFATPFIFMINIGFAVVYNMGTNMFLKDVSYITEALAAIMQLACTMDYSIFLLDSYKDYKKTYEGDKKRAMAHAIANTFTAVSASSLTTIAGFAALLVMTFQLGGNMGVVMIKGVAIGVITCVTVLPTLILSLDGIIEKTTHKDFVGSMDKISHFIVKYRYVFLVIFMILLVPAVYGNNHLKSYYDIAKSLPADLPSAIANDKLEEDFNMNTMHVVLLKGDFSKRDKYKLVKDMEKVKGVNYVLGLSSLIGPNVPDEMIPELASDVLKTDNYEMMLISSDYPAATDIMDGQVNELDRIIKSYSKSSSIIGEAPLMTDLARVSERDNTLVDIISIVAIFLIILFTFKSISLPIILVSVIELAICTNMAIPYYMNNEVAFIASIFIGTIQLGSTVDYAILMTSYYHKNRAVKLMNKKESVIKAHSDSMSSILTSGMCFFGATFGVAMYSNIDMIKQICMLLARGAVISMIMVICLLPAMLWILDPIIVRTSLDIRKAVIGKKLDKIVKKGVKEA
jgi:predicted RND superfamily exporter protein